MVEEVHFVDETRYNPIPLLLLGACAIRNFVALDDFGKVFKFDGGVHVNAGQDAIALLVRASCARLHPRVHLSDEEIEALSCVCFIVKNELTAQVVKFEKLNSNLVGIRDEQSLVLLGTGLE